MRKILVFMFSLLLLLPNIMPPSVEADTTEFSLPFGTTVFGTVSPSNQENVYKIIVPEHGTVHLKVTAYFPAVEMELRDSKNTLLRGPLWNLFNGKPDNPAISSSSMNLEPGEYSFIIKKWAFDYGAYQLDASFQPATHNETEPNQSILEAMPLQVNGDRVRGFLSLNDPNDFYKIVLTEPGLLLMEVKSDMMLGADIELLDENGKLISDQYVRSRNNEPINGKHYKNLEAGTYYFKVNSSGGTYEVGASLTPANNEEVEPNNDMQSAINILPGKKYTGFLSFTDREDYYQFEMPYDGYMTIDYTSVSNYFNVNVKDKENPIFFHYSSGLIGKPGMFSEKLELKKGKYYFYTNWDGNGGVYTLSLQTEPYPPENVPPVIIGATNKTLYINTTFNSMTGVKAKDNVDGDLTKAIKMTGTVNTKKKGVYTLNYSVTDQAGNVAKVSRKIIVVENVKPVIIGATNKTIKLNSTFNPRTGVTAKDNIEGNINYRIVISGKVNIKKKGTYTLTYSVTGKLGNKSVVTRKITVK